MSRQITTQVLHHASENGGNNVKARLTNIDVGASLIVGKRGKQGWHNESARHGLAAKGISTKAVKQKAARSKFRATNDSRALDSIRVDLQFEGASFRGQVELRLLEGEETGLAFLKVISDLSSSSPVSLDQMQMAIKSANVLDCGLTAPADNLELRHLGQRLISAGKCLAVPLVTESLKSWVVGAVGPEVYLILKILVISASVL